MKAVCISADASAPIAGCAPDSALVFRSNPWFVPADGNPGEWQARIYLAACIGRLGTHISPRFARRYYSAITAVAHPFNPGVNAAIEWCRDGAVITGTGTIPTADLTPGTEFSLVCNGEAITLSPEGVLDRLDAAVAKASEFLTLRTGDFVLVDAPVQPVPLAEHKDFDVNIAGERMFRFKTR